jgi:hypothetical protein
MKMKLSTQTYKNELKSAWAFVFIAGAILCITGCKKFVQVPSPKTSLSSGNVYTANATATAVLTGIYSTMSSGGVNMGPAATSQYCGLSADEYTLYQASAQGFAGYYYNAIDPVNDYGAADFWSNLYPVIFVANSAIAGLTNNTQLTPAVDQQLLGEAYFVRAFCYFYLVNLYGDVPLATTTSYQVNESLARSPKAAVYQQIVADLKQAQSLLSEQYLDGTVQNPTTERVRPTKWAATALLARVYLFTGDWQNAQAAASMVIANTANYSLASLNDVFLKNSAEAIWQLQPVTIGQNTPDAVFFIIPASGPSNSNPVYLSNNLLNSFEPGDQRLVNWVNQTTVALGSANYTYYYPYKYKVNTPNASVTEYEMVLRLGEQYLIRAEAEAEQKDITDAAADLNAIRARAGLPPTTAGSQAEMLTAILHERQVELFSEWGHRWLDLKRTATVDSVMSIATPEKGGTWKSSAQLYPVPQNDLQTDTKLVQNPGY